MIKGITKVFEFLGGSLLPPWLMVTTIIWLIGFLICYFLGGIALWRIGRLGGQKKIWLSWLPGVQIYCEAQFCGRPQTAKRIQHCLWWFWVALLGCITCGIWMASGIAGVAEIPTEWMKWMLIGLLICGLILYFLIRADELTCLRKVFQNDTLWWISIAGSIFCLPLQRIFLFSLTQEEDEFDDEEEEEDEED